MPPRDHPPPYVFASRFPRGLSSIQRLRRTHDSSPRRSSQSGTIRNTGFYQYSHQSANATTPFYLRLSAATATSTTRAIHYSMSLHHHHHRHYDQCPLRHYCTTALPSTTTSTTAPAAIKLHRRRWFQTEAQPS